jgi:hypothetical protein
MAVEPALAARAEPGNRSLSGVVCVPPLGRPPPCSYLRLPPAVGAPDCYAMYKTWRDALPCTLGATFAPARTAHDEQEENCDGRV